MENGKQRMRKSFPVFDCDAHINDPVEIWENYVEPKDRELVGRAYWCGGATGFINERQMVMSGNSEGSGPKFINLNALTVSGPGVNKRVKRRLMRTRLNHEQVTYLDHRGAYDAHARVRDLDLMGIDQVLVIPTMLINNLYFVENPQGAAAFARAYNNWVFDWCKAQPQRLFPAAIFALQNTRLAVEEIYRVAKLGFRVVLLRPIDAGGLYPNRLDPDQERATSHGHFGINYTDALFRAIEDTGMVLGMHTFTPPLGVGMEVKEKPISPGDILTRTGAGSGRVIVGSTFSFIFEAMTWLAQVLLAGFLDRYPRLKMAIFESNAAWLPELLEHCDLLVKLYANERKTPLKRLPSEAFYQQCMISFESDEELVFRTYNKFENIGVWASDMYHPDAEDVWEAIRHMERAGVPERVQAKMLGGNARRFYGIEPQVFVNEQAPPIRRPRWFPEEDEEFRQWWQREVNQENRY
jgi:predicted TIM-barrel fold metal-dependent hydrolase